MLLNRTYASARTEASASLWGTGEQPLSGFAVSRLVCVAAEHQVAQRAGVAGLAVRAPAPDLVQPTLGEQEGGSPQQSGVADRPARRQRSSRSNFVAKAAPPRWISSSAPFASSSANVSLVQFGGGHPVPISGDTTEVYGRRAMKRLTPRRRQVVVNREPVERVREVDQKMRSPGSQRTKRVLSRRSSATAGSAQDGDPCDQRQRAALAQHRQRRRQLSRRLGQLGQRGDGRG